MSRRGSNVISDTCSTDIAGVGHQPRYTERSPRRSLLRLTRLTVSDLAPVAEGTTDVAAVNRLVALVHRLEALNVRPTALASHVSVR